MTRAGRRATPARGEGRGAILDAVVRIVAQKGLDALTVRAVAAQARVTHGLVSYHFPTREEMIQEALERETRNALVRQSVDSTTSGVRGFAAGLSKLVAEDPDRQAFQQLLKLQSRRRPAVRRQIAEVRDLYFESVKAGLERLGLHDNEPLARMVLATLDGLVFQQLILDDPDLTDEAIECLQFLLLLAIEHASNGNLEASLAEFTNDLGGRRIQAEPPRS